MVFVYAPVGENQNIRAVPIGAVGFHKQPVDRFFQTCILIIGNRQHGSLKSFHLHRFDFHKIRVRQDWIVDL